ncbi:sigma-70 family RNA polymerase sigma factor [bacterium]|nr:sigma-70 family RNA polymerase sigma factor [bacterium]MCP5461713.1 sigma-70 family RNA polymerase sigma factor [bacterium]
MMLHHIKTCTSPVSTQSEFAESFSVLHDFYYKKFLSIANNPLNDTALAEQRVQIAFVKMHAEFNSLLDHSEEGFISWVRELIQESLNDLKSMEQKKIREMLLEYHVIICATHERSSSSYNASFAVLWKEFYKPLFYIAKGILRSEQYAENCVSESFVKINHSFHTLNNRTLSGFTAWAIIIVRRTAINIWNKLKKSDHLTMSIYQPLSRDTGDCRSLLDKSIAQWGFELPVWVDVHSCINEISRCVKELKDKKQSTIFNLYWSDGYKYIEIAKKMNISISRVSKSMYVTKKAIVKKLSCVGFRREEVKTLLSILEKAKDKLKIE